MLFRGKEQDKVYKILNDIVSFLNKQKLAEPFVIKDIDKDFELNCYPTGKKMEILMQNGKDLPIAFRYMVSHKRLAFYENEITIIINNWQYIKSYIVHKTTQEKELHDLVMSKIDNFKL